MTRILLFVACLSLGETLAIGAEPGAEPFPMPLEQYQPPAQGGILATIHSRAVAEPFNVVATVIFLLAIVHTFLAPKFMHIAHRWRAEYAARRCDADLEVKPPNGCERVDFKAEVMHFFGEVEAIFGIWVVPLLGAITLYKGWPTAEEYISRGVNFTEPMFVVIIMAISATRPILRFAEQFMRLLAGIGKHRPAAWWFSILTVGPLLGSFITEPAAMTICALLLARQFYELSPSLNFRYGTLGLLFVNISVGGTLTHFAAPPVLMVAGKWGWDMGFMFTSFGWKAATGILLANTLYYYFFRSEFAKLHPAPNADETPVEWSDRTDRVPRWITVVHILFLSWTVFTAHYPALFIGGFLFFLAFVTATNHHQNPISLKPAMLVGFFLGGLVIHGGLQGWWIEPVLANLSEIPLLLGATVLTAFNDNAAITYLASLVPEFTEELKYAVVAGAVAGGGLTVIANAPNPAGQSILSCYFPEGIAPLKLFLAALLPTLIMLGAFLLLP